MNRRAFLARGGALVAAAVLAPMAASAESGGTAPRRGVVEERAAACAAAALFLSLHPTVRDPGLSDGERADRIARACATEGIGLVERPLPRGVAALALRVPFGGTVASYIALAPRSVAHQRAQALLVAWAHLRLYPTGGVMPVALTPAHGVASDGFATRRADAFADAVLAACWSEATC